MRKKILLSLLSLAMVSSLFTGCGSKDKGGNTPNEATSATTGNVSSTTSTEDTSSANSEAVAIDNSLFQVDVYADCDGADTKKYTVINVTNNSDKDAKVTVTYEKEGETKETPVFVKAGESNATTIYIG